jgi:hypothetical protein
MTPRRINASSQRRLRLRDTRVEIVIWGAKMKTTITLLLLLVSNSATPAHSEQHRECSHRFEATANGGCFLVCTGKLVSDQFDYKLHHPEDGDGHLGYYRLRDEQLVPGKPWLHVVTNRFVYRGTSSLNCHTGEWCRVIGNYFGGAFGIWIGSPLRQLSIEERDNWKDDGLPPISQKITKSVSQSSYLKRGQSLSQIPASVSRQKWAE